MKESLITGLTRTCEITVDTARTIGFMGEGARVYATPALVADIEQTCRDLLKRHLDEAEDSVGTRVELDHMAATPKGLRVTIQAMIASVEGRLVGFDVVAHDPIDQICRCAHNRFVVDIDKTKERLAAKAARAGGV